MGESAGSKKDTDAGQTRAGLSGSTVLAFESRMGAELGNLIQRHGGVPIVVASMREVPLQENRAALEFLLRLERGEIDVVIALTGVGVRTLAGALAETCPPARLASLLQGTTLVARGPKPVAALRELGLKPQVTVPEPNTWHELLSTLDRKVSLQGRLVAVQEYGKRNAELIEGLEARGATVLPVPVYRWALPEDTRPLEEAVRRLASPSEGPDFVLFTSATQVVHVMQTARELGLSEAVLDAATRLVVGSVGPVCSEELREQGLSVDLEPEHPKMGHLVLALARHGPLLLASKRASSVRSKPSPAGRDSSGGGAHSP